MFQHVRLRSTGRQHQSAAAQQPISRQGVIGRAEDPAAHRSTVHYYWGVPFCPQGLDPDSYTQVCFTLDTGLKEVNGALVPFSGRETFR